LKLIHEENHIIDDDEDLKMIREELKNGKHTCLYICMEHPRMFKVLK